MSWIKEVSPPLNANVIRVMSLRPKAMRAVEAMGNSIAHGGSPLTLVQEEAIATVVSVINKCRY